MKISRLLYVIAIIIVAVWALGLLFKIAAWLISSLLYIAALIVIIGLVRNWWENRKAHKSDTPFLMLDILVSTTKDGSMKSIHEDDMQSVNTARTTFLQAHDILPRNTTLVRLTYDREDFCRFITVSNLAMGDGITRASSIISDALITTQPHHALFLPLADCIGAVIHDSSRGILMVLHLGRHNLEQSSGIESINYLRKNYGIDPGNLTVWLSPAAGKESYPLFRFNNQSLHSIAIEQLIAAGISKVHITASSIDSANDPNYFSHSQYLKGNQETDGRHAIVAVMR